MANGYSETKIVYSNGQTDLFPQNRPHEFTNKLAQPLHLDANWEVALLDIQYYHKWNNILHDVKAAVLIPHVRSERLFRSELLQNSGSKLELSIRKRFPRITDDMLKAKKLPTRRVGFLLVFDGARYRRFDYLIDFPEFGHVQNFNTVLPNDVNYDRYTSVRINRYGPDNVRDVTKDKMAELLSGAINDLNFESEKKILRKIVRERPGKPIVYYTQAIPSGAIFHRYENRRSNPVVDEIASYSERFDHSIEVEHLALPQSYKTKMQEITWFRNHVSQIENYLNERDLHRYVMSKQLEIKQCYYESITSLCDSFCKEVSMLLCDSDDSKCFTYVYDKNYEKISFIVDKKYLPLRILCDSDYLSHIFGIAPVLKATTRDRPPSPMLPPESPTKLPPGSTFDFDKAALQHHDAEDDASAVPFVFDNKKWERDVYEAKERRLAKKPNLAMEVSEDVDDEREHVFVTDGTTVTGDQMKRNRATVPKATKMVREETSYVYEFPCESVQPARLDTVNSLIVYSDVGEYLDTGGMLTRHLARFDVSDRPGQQVSYAPHQPIYVPVSKSEIDYITIYLRDEYGRVPPFSKDHDCSVSVKLHFRNPKAQ
jgi:hypothetical protein